MDVLIWLNTMFLTFAAVAEGIIFNLVLRGGRGDEVLSRSAESLARAERITLATLERLSTQQGSQVLTRALTSMIEVDEMPKPKWPKACRPQLLMRKEKNRRPAIRQNRSG